MKNTVLFGLFWGLLIFHEVSGVWFGIYSCRLGCSDKKYRRRRDTITVLSPYSPYGLVHTYIKINDRCYHLDSDGPEAGYCNSILRCCNDERRERYSGYTSCQDRAEHFASYWMGFRHNIGRRIEHYRVFEWNCQVYVNLLKRFLLNCYQFSDNNSYYLSGYGDK